MRRILMLAVILSSLVGLVTAQSQPQIDPQKVIVNQSQNDLKVQVSVDRSGNNPSYKIGEKVRITVGVNQDAYVYLFSIHFDGQMDLIQPNKLSSGNAFMRAGETKSFPPSNGGYLLQIDGPVGQDKILAVVSKRQLNIDQIASFKGNQPFATLVFNGQDNLAKSLSSVLASLDTTEWVSEVANYQVLPRNSTTSTLKSGTVRIVTRDNAQIFLDGTLVGQAPKELTAAAGRHELRVKLEGYQDFLVTINVVESRTLNVTAPLIPINSREGTLSITSMTAGATVYVDGQQVGKTAIDGTFRISGLPVGKHSVTVIAQGYETQSQPLTIEGGQISTLTFNPSGSSSAQTTTGAATTTTPGKPAATPVPTPETQPVNNPAPEPEAKPVATTPTSSTIATAPTSNPISTLPRTNIRALVIGIGSYDEDRIPKLESAESDAKKFAAALTDPKIGNISSENVESLVGSKATKTRIESRIKALASQTKPGETLIVYFSGHGAPSTKGEASLVPWDADPNDLTSSVVTLRDVQSARTAGGNLVLILDSCFSGEKGSRSVTDPSARPFGVVVKTPAVTGNVSVLSASGSDQSSFENSSVGGGYFTTFLIEGMKDGVADLNSDGVVSLEEAFNYAKPKVEAAARSRNSAKQTPQLKGAGGFTLAVNLKAVSAARADKLSVLLGSGKISPEQFEKLLEQVSTSQETPTLKSYLDGSIGEVTFLAALKSGGIPGVPKR